MGKQKQTPRKTSVPRIKDLETPEEKQPKSDEPEWVDVTIRVPVVKLEPDDVRRKTHIECQLYGPEGRTMMSLYMGCRKSNAEVFSHGQRMRGQRPVASFSDVVRYLMNQVSLAIEQNGKNSEQSD